MDSKYCKNDCEFFIKRNHINRKQIVTCKKFINSNGGSEIRLKYKMNRFLKCYACLKNDTKEMIK